MDDLMTLNYISDDSEMLYPWQELFINITEQRAYDIGLLEKAQPILPKDEVIKPKIPTKKNTWTKNTTIKQNTNNSIGTNITTPKSSKIIKQWYYNPKISNGFAVWYCTWYVAIKSPHIFKYTSETRQERPFGGNAINWYANAKAAGFSVGQIPRVWAIIVYKQLRSAAGHVGIVRSYNASTWEMVIEDMNFVWKYIVTQRIESTSNDKIIGYIYG
jgi:surface antigen